MILTHLLAPSIHSPLSPERLPHHKPRKPALKILLCSESSLKGKCLQVPQLDFAHHKVKYYSGLALPPPLVPNTGPDPAAGVN